MYPFRLASSDAPLLSKILVIIAAMYSGSTQSLSRTSTGSITTSRTGTCSISLSPTPSVTPSNTASSTVSATTTRTSTQTPSTSITAYPSNGALPVTNAGAVLGTQMICGSTQTLNSWMFGIGVMTSTQTGYKLLKGYAAAGNFQVELWDDAVTAVLTTCVFTVTPVSSTTTQMIRYATAADSFDVAGIAQGTCTLVQGSTSYAGQVTYMASCPATSFNFCPSASSCTAMSNFVQSNNPGVIPNCGAWALSVPAAIQGKGHTNSSSLNAPRFPSPQLFITGSTVELVQFGTDPFAASHPTSYQVATVQTYCVQYSTYTTVGTTFMASLSIESQYVSYDCLLVTLDISTPSALPSVFFGYWNFDGCTSTQPYVTLNSWTAAPASRPSPSSSPAAPAHYSLDNGPAAAPLSSVSAGFVGLFTGAAGVFAAVGLWSLWHKQQGGGNAQASRAAAADVVQVRNPYTPDA